MPMHPKLEARLELRPAPAGNYTAADIAEARRDGAREALLWAAGVCTARALRASTLGRRLEAEDRRDLRQQRVQEGVRERDGRDLGRVLASAHAHRSRRKIVNEVKPKPVEPFCRVIHTGGIYDCDTEADMWELIGHLPPGTEYTIMGRHPEQFSRSVHQQASN